MDCQQAQNDLLSAESLTLLGPELSAHLAECPDCQTLLAKLRRLEAQANALPVPAGHEQPPPGFLRRIVQLAAQSGPPIRHFMRRAIAAGVILAFGLAALSLIFFNGSTVQADVLIGQLVDWNLTIAHMHDAATRTRLYQQQLQQLQSQANQPGLALADQALARALLNNAQWLTTEDNATDESQHFQSLANQLLTRQQAASDGAAAHLQQIYQQLINQGVSSGSNSAVSPSTTQQNTNQTAPAPSSALPQNSTVIPQSMKAGIVAAVPVESNSVATAQPSRFDFSSPGISTGDSSTIYIPRPLGAADTGSRPTGTHVHHSGPRPGGGESVAIAGASTHTNPLPANLASASPPIKTNVGPSVHPLPVSVSTPGTTMNSGGQSFSWPASNSLTPPSGRSMPLASLQDIADSGPPMHWNHSAAWSMDISATLDQQSLIDPSMLPLSPSGMAISRHEIESILARHIIANSLDGSDWTMPPPFRGEDDWSFFHLSDVPQPTAFPEPALGVLALLGIFAAPRRRRIMEIAGTQRLRSPGTR